MQAVHSRLELPPGRNIRGPIKSSHKNGGSSDEHRVKKPNQEEEQGT